MTDTLWLTESPLEIIEGEVIVYEVEWEDADTVTGTTAKVFYNDDDVTSDVMITGAFAQSGNVSTLKGITALAAHENGSYVVSVQAAVDGNTEKRKLLLDVLDEAAVS
jgi:hypothetical protein